MNEIRRANAFRRILLDLIRNVRNTTQLTGDFKPDSVNQLLNAYADAADRQIASVEKNFNES